MLSLRSAFRSFSRAPLLSLLSITTIAFSGRGNRFTFSCKKSR